MGPCSVSTRSQSKPTDAISSATSGSPKFRRLPKHAFPARNRCFTWLGVIGRQYSAGENRRVEEGAGPVGSAPQSYHGRIGKWCLYRLLFYTQYDSRSHISLCIGIIT